jgi:hypothetical protein
MVRVLRRARLLISTKTYQLAQRGSNTRRTPEVHVSFFNEHSKYPPAKPGALRSGPLKAAIEVANATSQV